MPTYMGDYQQDAARLGVGSEAPLPPVPVPTNRYTERLGDYEISVEFDSEAGLLRFLESTDKIESLRSMTARKTSSRRGGQ